MFGIFGALRTDELVKLTVKNIEKPGKLLVVYVPIENKTSIQRWFTISKDFAIAIVEI